MWLIVFYCLAGTLNNTTVCIILHWAVFKSIAQEFLYIAEQ